MKMYLGIIKFIASFFLAALLISACTSREEQVAETIKENMFKTLYDFDSYQPIETKIDTLKSDIYGDTLVYDHAMLAKALFDEYRECEKEIKEQESIIDIYTPTAYSSESSDKKYKEAIDKCKELLV